MGNGCRKQNENVYFKARKKAAAYNPRLSSREGASEILGVSESTLADYELGNTKVVPVDKVVLMADLYRAPELLNGYCKNECPIGRDMPIATVDKGIQGIAISILHEFRTRRIDVVLKSGEKDAIIDKLDEISGYQLSMEETAKN